MLKEPTFARSADFDCPRAFRLCDVRKWEPEGRMVELIALPWLGRQCWQHARSASETTGNKEDAYRLVMATDVSGERHAQRTHYIAFSGQANTEVIRGHVSLAAVVIVVALGWHDIFAAGRFVIHWDPRYLPASRPSAAWPLCRRASFGVELRDARAARAI